jgi:D-alanyl-D-alanine carboxypeptidase
MAISTLIRPRRIDSGRSRSVVVGVLAVAAVVAISVGFGAIGLGVNVGPPAVAGLPGCSVAELPVELGGYDDWASTLLDPSHTLGPLYRPPDLSTGRIGGQVVKLRDFVLQPLTHMVAAAAADGVTLSVTSAYRPYAFQQQLFDTNPGMDDLIARPGHSEHQLGTTVDLSGGDEWLAQHAAQFGFVLSFPADRSPGFTCYSNEPWHYRYFGPDRAAAIKASRLSPREYLWQNH